MKKINLKSMEGQAHYNNKGFTLIELLAVIVVLAIIALIATPLVLNVIDNARKGAFKSSVYGIIASASNSYYLDKINDREIKEVIYTYENGIETSNIIGRRLSYKGSKPKSGNIIMSKSGKISLALHDGEWCARKEINKEEIEIEKRNQEECITPIHMPEIELIGESEINIEIKAEYIELGYIGRSITGEDITEQIKIEIKKDNVIVERVETSELTTYEITYSLENEEKYVEVKRIVKIVDTIEPNLEIPSNVSIMPHEVETYDLMEGVRAEDNSGEEIEVVIIGNISNYPGIYKITYRAEDSSQNKIEKDRYITVLDDEGPEITLNGDNPMTIVSGDTYNEPGAVAIDDVDGDISENIIISGNVSSIPEAYEIRYEVSDSAGNTTIVIRTVIVTIPIQPTSWKYLENITSTREWEVPRTGWYQIHVIGKGGNGGSGADGILCTNINSRWGKAGGGGGGGGGGGLAISQLFLTTGTKINIVINSTQTTFDGTVIAKSGNNGDNAPSLVANECPGLSSSGQGAGGYGGTAGSASGGNILNIRGNAGKSGGGGRGVSYEATNGTTYPSGLSGTGGKGSEPIIANKYYSSPSVETNAQNIIGTHYPANGNIGKTAKRGTTNNPMFGGGGSGGNGGGAKGDNTYYSGRSGGSGAPGGVVIEIPQ